MEDIVMDNLYINEDILYNSWTDYLEVNKNLQYDFFTNKNIIGEPNREPIAKEDHRKTLKELWNKWGNIMRNIAYMIYDGKWSDEIIKEKIPNIKKVLVQLYKYAMKVVGTDLNNFAWGTMDEFRVRLHEIAKHLHKFVPGDKVWRSEALCLFNYHDLYWYE